MLATWFALRESPVPSVTTLMVGSATSSGLVNSTPGAFLSPLSVSFRESNLAVSPADWLVGSGLPVEDGVLCDEQLRVVGAEHVFAAGDVARWPCPFADSPVRIEHWTNANEHGALVAASIMGEEAPRAQPPYVWSDQYGHRIQIAGIPRAGQPALVAGSVAEGTLVALFADDEQRTVGAVVLDDARTFMRARRAVGARTPVGQVDLGLAAATGSDTGRRASQTQTTRRND